MPTDEQLELSEASRRRAWGALQDIRTVLGTAGIVDLPPSKRPRRFDVEGGALVQGLEQTLRRIEMVVGELTAAVEAIRPFLMGEGKREGFPQAHLRLNRALAAANGLLPLVTK